MKLQFQPHWLMGRAIRQWGRRVFWVVLFCLSLLMFPWLGHSLTIDEVPNPQELRGAWVSDMANVLNEDTERQLNQMISALEAENGSEIAVVTVVNTASQPSPKRFATRLFNDWGIGKAEVDNGVLFLHSVGDRRVEIETGYGVEEILPDAKVGAILDREILPRFGDNDFDGGTLAGVEAMITALSGGGVISGQRSGILVNELIFSPLSLYVLCVAGIVGLPVWIYRRTVHILDNPPILFPLGRSRVLDPNSYGMPKFVLRSLYILSFFLCLAVFALTLILDPSARLWLAAMGVLGVFVIRRWVVSPKLESYYISRGFKSNDSPNDQSSLKDLKVVELLLCFWVIPLLVILFFTIDTTDHSQLGAGMLSLPVSLLGAWAIGGWLKAWMHKQWTPLCGHCQRPMKRMNLKEHKLHLNRSQRFATNLKSTAFEGWTCPHCTPEPSRFHLRSHLLNEQYFSECPNCQEFTVTYGYKVTKQPTPDREGTLRKTATCHACDHTKSEDKPLRPGSSSAVAAGFSGGGGGAGGCGGFGGGGSGGGGAGGGY